MIHDQVLGVGYSGDRKILSHDNVSRYETSLRRSRFAQLHECVTSTKSGTLEGRIYILTPIVLGLKTKTLPALMSSTYRHDNSVDRSKETYDLRSDMELMNGLIRYDHIV